MPKTEHLIGAAATSLSLLCGGWALWPLAFPAPAAPSVTRAALPQVEADPAPIYPTTSSVKPLLSGRLNLNTASKAQLEALPGVGPAFAERIIAARPLKSLSDLDRVKGVGPVMLERLKDRVSF